MRKRTVTTEAAVNAYIASCKARALAPKTLETYAWALAPLRNASQRLPARPEALENVLAGLHLSPESRHAVFRAWRTFYAWAEKRLGVANATQQLAPPRRRQLLPRTLSEDHVDQLLQLELPRRDRALLLVLLDTGLRVGELAGLRRPDVGTAAFTVSGKCGMRQVPVSPHVRAALTGVGDGPELWVGPKGPLTLSGVKQAVRRAPGRAGNRAPYRAGVRRKRCFQPSCRAQEFDPYGCDPCRWTSWARQVRLARTPSLFIQSDSDEILGSHSSSWTLGTSLQHGQ